MANKLCKTCGAEKPLNEMSKNKNSAGGYENICKECKNSKKRVERIESKRKEDVWDKPCSVKFIHHGEPAVLPPPQEFIIVKPSEKTIEAALSMYLTIDFSKHPGLLEILEARASEDFRTIEMQVLHYIQEGVNAP